MFREGIKKPAIFKVGGLIPCLQTSAKNICFLQQSKIPRIDKKAPRTPTFPWNVLKRGFVVCRNVCKKYVLFYTFPW